MSFALLHYETIKMRVAPKDNLLQMDFPAQPVHDAVDSPNLIKEAEI